MKTIKTIVLSVLLTLTIQGISYATFLTPDIRVNTGVAPGTVLSSSPKISSLSDGHVYAVWADNRNGNPDIFFNYSNDYGLSWQASDIRVNVNNPPGGAFSLSSPQICSLDDGHVFVTWGDSSSGKWEIYFNVSTDFGKTWAASTVRRIDTNYLITGGATPKNIECNIDGHVYISWSDNRNGIFEPYFNVSSDFGNTWLPNDIRLNTGTSPGSSDTGFGGMCNTNNGHVYVVWIDTRNSATNYDIYLNQSSDYGLTWQTPDIRIDRGDAAGASRSDGVDISCQDDGYVYVAWMDWRSPGGIILLNYSSNYGSTWLITSRRVDLPTTDTASSEYPEIASTSDGHVYVVWEDRRLGAQSAVLFNSSSNHGSTWGANPITLNLSPGIYYTDFPKIAATNTGGIYIAWHDAIYNPGDLYFNRSIDYGVTWLTSPIYADTGDPIVNGSGAVEISANNGRAYLVWKDNRNGGISYPDIYSNVWTETSNPMIPTLNEYGMIILTTILFSLIVLFSRRLKRGRV